MAQSNLEIAQKMGETSDSFYKEAQAKFDDYHKINLKYQLLKNKYGELHRNEHQDRELNQLKASSDQLGAEIESNLKPFTNTMLNLCDAFDNSSLSSQATVLKFNILNLVNLLETADLSDIEEIVRELKLSLDSFIKQLQLDVSRKPKTFAKKPDVAETDLKQGPNKVSDITNILDFVVKSGEAFQSKIAKVSQIRFADFMKTENQRLELLEEIVPDLKKIFQYLKSDEIDDSKLSEMVGEVVAVLTQASRLPSIPLPSFMAGRIYRVFWVQWVNVYLGDMEHSIAGGDHNTLKKVVEDLLQKIDSVSNSKMSSANKISDDFMAHLIADNEANITYIKNYLDKFLGQNLAISQSMPKALMDEIGIINNPPSVANKDADKIWSDYKVWYNKLEDAVRDSIDFVKMYYSIKGLYPFTIALRAVDKKGRDVDTQDYVHSMQELLNEALDKGKKMATSKKTLVAKLFNFYPADERVARAYYRIFEDV